MPAAKPVQLERPIKFDEAMRRLVNMPPPPSGKKAARKRKDAAKATRKKTSK